MHLLRVCLAVAHHVACGPRVIPEYVVYLRLGEGQELGWRSFAGGATQGPPGGGQVIGVHGEEEGSTGDKLEVVPPLPEQQPTGSPSNVACPLPQASAHEILRLLLVLLKDRRAVRRLPL